MSVSGKGRGFGRTVAAFRLAVLALAVSQAPAGLGPRVVPADSGGRTPGKIAGWLAGPFCFIENRGQVDERVLFYHQGSGRSTFFTAEGVFFCFLTKGDGWAVAGRDGTGEPALAVSSLVLRPLGARLGKPVGEDKLAGMVSFFMGNAPERWRRDVPTYRRVRYPDVFPGVHLVFRGS